MIPREQTGSQLFVGWVDPERHLPPTPGVTPFTFNKFSGYPVHIVRENPPVAE